MKKILVLLLMFAPLSIFAQQKFGYRNSMEIVQLMPEYAKAQTNLTNLQKTYSEEYDRLRSDIEKKGLELEQLKDSLPANIVQRRQTELEGMIGRLQQYEQESYQHLQQAQAKELEEVNKVLREAIKAVGQAGGYVCIFDVAGGVPYISESLCEDVTVAVKTKLGISPTAVAPR